MKNVEEITLLIRPLIDACGEEFFSECLECKVRCQGTTVIISVIADKASGGITVSECARINRAIAQKIEEEGSLGEDFVVEVSSPGLEWPLCREKDFARVVGRSVRCHLAEPIEGKREYSGVVKSVGSGRIELLKGQTSLWIPLDKLNKAFQIL